MTTKPDKPSPDYPLFPHACGKWAKKIEGKLRYFGRWTDPRAALDEYLAYEAARKAVPASTLPPGRMTLEEACNHFLQAKKEARDRGELSPITFTEYLGTCKRFVEHVGRGSDIMSLEPAAFSGFKTMMSARRNVVGLGNEITRIRSLFKWLHEARILKEPMWFGPDFRKASAKARRKHRRLAGKKLFTAAEIRRLLDYSGVQMRAMILLGINAGFGPTDCATLPLDALAGDWLHYPRPKTEVDRDIPLWPETQAALAAVLDRRYEPLPEAANMVFVQHDGRTWNTSGKPVCKSFRKIYQWAGLKRAGFYWLRHTFETVGGGAKDQIAVNAIMGHTDSSMAAVYREEIEQERLLAVADHVRAWLFR